MSVKLKRTIAFSGASIALATGIYFCLGHKASIKVPSNFERATSSIGGTFEPAEAPSNQLPVVGAVVSDPMPWDGVEPLSDEEKKDLRAC